MIIDLRVSSTCQTFLYRRRVRMLVMSVTLAHFYMRFSEHQVLRWSACENSLDQSNMILQVQTSAAGNCPADPQSLAFPQNLPVLAPTPPITRPSCIYNSAPPMYNKPNPCPCLCLLLLHLVLSQPQSLAPPRMSLLGSAPGAASDDAARYQEYVYQNNRRIVEQNNARPDRNYELAVNEFAVLTEREVRQKYSGLIPSSEASVRLARALGKQGVSVLKGFTPNSIAGISANAVENVDVDSLEREVLDKVREYMKGKNVPQEEIDNLLIPKFRREASTQQSIILPPNLRRLLQKIQFVSADTLQSTVTVTKIQQPVIQNIDWSCVSGRVKAQGDCGACYAFAASDSVGALMAIYYYTFFIDLSIQQLIDCSKNSLVFGCEGGFIEGVYSHMMDLGVYTDYTYPYNPLVSDSSRNQSACRNWQRKPKFKIQDFRTVTRGSCSDLRLQLQKQPIAVGIAGYKLVFYRSGVFDGCDGSDELDHAVLLVGYKKGTGWKIKNSWGVRWGEAGYAWIADGNMCRVCQIGLYALPAFGRGLEEYSMGNKMKTCPKP